MGEKNRGPSDKCERNWATSDLGNENKLVSGVQIQHYIIINDINFI